MDSAQPGEGSPREPVRRIGSEGIRAIMSDQALCVVSGTAISDVLARMRDDRASCALVCAEEKLVGIFTERDHLDRTAGDPASLGRPVDDFMSVEPFALGPEATLAELLSVVVARGYRHVPVIERGKPIGIVAAQDIVKYIADLFPEAVYNLPPQLDQVIPQVEGA